MAINQTNYEQYLIAKLENQLSQAELAELNRFMQQHPEIKAEWEAFKSTVLVPDEGIVFTGKQALKQPVPTRKVMALYRNLVLAVGIAAALAFILYTNGLRVENTGTTAPVATVAANQPVKQTTGSYSRGNATLATAGTTTGNNATTSFNVNNTVIASATNNAGKANISGTLNTNVGSGGSLLAGNQPVIAKHKNNNNYITTAVQVNNPGYTGSQPVAANTERVPVEIVSLNTAPINLIPVKSRNARARYLPAPNAPVETAQPAEKASWIQVASVLGAELYHLSGRGELAMKDSPAKSNINTVIKNKKSVLLTIFHSRNKTNPSK